MILPLVAIATPATYVKEPLKVFELDFEANLPIVRSCVKYGKRILFPSTSEVYGMCRDEQFDPYASELILGPIDKQRWIYSCSKQLMDRVIWAYGSMGQLDFTLFRPFNWIGSGLDSIHTAKEGSSRVITQFLGHIVRGEPIRLVDGGSQKRAFTYIDDGIDALMKRVKELNMPAVAMTDHGNLYGAIDFYMAAKKAKVKSILGCEAYLAPGSMMDKNEVAGRKRSSHLTLLAASNEGFDNLSKLITKGHLDGQWYRPRIDKDALREHSKGLICLSGCINGEIVCIDGGRREFYWGDTA